MPARRLPPSRVLLSVWPLCALLLLFACGKEAAPPASTEKAKPAAPAEPVATVDQPPPPSSAVVLPKGFGRHTGDLDDMAKRRNIRALVILNPIAFFYDKG